MALARPHEWEAFLTREMETPVQVSFGRSRTAPIQVRWKETRPSVRLHRMFGEAPDEVCEAVVAWLQHGRRARRACRLLDRWIHDALEALPSEPERAPTLSPRGDVHDLARLSEELYRGILRGEFDDAHAPPSLTWGRRARSRSRHTLQLGSFDPERRLVRIHPVLDQAAVPAWFVRYVLFHEHLHAILPVERDGADRWVHHPPEFRRREARYEDYARALAWEKQNLPRLIRSARTGKPLGRRPVERAATVIERVQGLLFP